MAQARGAGIDAFDLLPALRESGLGTREIYLLPHDGRPAPGGSIAAAQALERALLSGGLAPERCRTGDAPRPLAAPRAAAHGGAPELSVGHDGSSPASAPARPETARFLRRH